MCRSPLRVYSMLASTCTCSRERTAFSCPAQALVGISMVISPAAFSSLQDAFKWKRTRRKQLLVRRPPWCWLFLPGWFRIVKTHEAGLFVEVSCHTVCPAMTTSIYINADLKTFGYLKKTKKKTELIKSIPDLNDTQMINILCEKENQFVFLLFSNR